MADMIDQEVVKLREEKKGEFDEPFLRSFKQGYLVALKIAAQKLKGLIHDPDIVERMRQVIIHSLTEHFKELRIHGKTEDYPSTQNFHREFFDEFPETVGTSSYFDGDIEVVPSMDDIDDAVTIDEILSTYSSDEIVEAIRKLQEELLGEQDIGEGDLEEEIQELIQKVAVSPSAASSSSKPTIRKVKIIRTESSSSSPQEQEEKPGKQRKSKEDL